MPKHTHGQETCYCSAYPFPHRAGSGACKGPGSHLCSECGQVAEPHQVDFGFGAYEYWGANCVHHDYQVVSKCCNAYLVSNTPLRTYAANIDLID